jgi:hypothetical protein
MQNPNLNIQTDRVIGIDLSPNHGAIVALDHGKLIGYQFVSEIQSIVKKSKGNGVHLRIKKISDMHDRGIQRSAFWYYYLCEICETYTPEYWGIEDYAYRASQGAHQIGEIGCLGRIVPWVYGAKVRLHGPESIKLFVSHNGTASKEDVQDDCSVRWPETEQLTKYKTEKNRTTVEDLFDAYALAQLIWLEVQVRRGDVQLKTLHPKEIQVFNRLTKRWPVNLLGREWIQMEERWTPSKISSLI